MKNLSEYQGLFFREKRPYWVIFDKKGVRKAAVPSDTMEIEDKKERLDDSWNILLEAESDLVTGEYRLVLQHGENGGKGKLVQDFVVGNPQPSASVGNTGRISSQSVGGLNGIEFVTGLMKENQSEINRYRDQITDLKFENLKQANEIERIKREKKDKKEDDGIGALLKGIVKDHFPTILKTVYPQTFTPTTVIASVESDGDVVDASEVDAKMDFQKRFQAIFADIEVLFPNENPLDVMETVIELAKGSAMVVGMVKETLAKKKQK